MNFYKRYMGDFAKKTAHLSMTEQGAYDRLLDHYYAMQRPLPADKQGLYQIARAMAPVERRAVDKVANEFFPVAGDGMRHNKRADAEIEKHEAQASKNREIGKLGGRPRLTETDTDSDTERVSEPEPNREPNNNPKPEARSQEDQNLSPPGFVLFWNDWPAGPRKQARGKCLILWRRKHFESRAAEILAHVAAMKETEQWRTGFIPAPLVYLGQERWDGAETEVKQDRRVAL